MDNSAREITFDAHGVCNFCRIAEKELASIGGPVPNLKTKNQYDVLIGLSGGVDSSYTLHKAVELGLRPLCFSVDTGYNKPEADENIMRLVEGLKVPFYRQTIDLNEFHRLQAAFMHAGVPNIEIPTDHVLMAASYKLAADYGIRVILSGGNVATESIMPPSWGYNARDLTHIKAIYRRFMHQELKNIPTCGIWEWNYYRWIRRIKTVYLLDFVGYHREKSEKELEKLYGFKSTGDKHEENYFTWWFQNYYLLKRFGFDKRKAHYSSRIKSGQMTRAEALQRLAESPIYPEMGFEQKVMGYKKHRHEDYPMDKWYPRISKFIRYVGIK